MHTHWLLREASAFSAHQTGTRAPPTFFFHTWIAQVFLTREEAKMDAHGCTMNWGWQVAYWLHLVEVSLASILTCVHNMYTHGIYTYIYIYTHIYIYIYIYIYKYLYIHIYTYLYTDIYIYIYVYTHRCTDTHTPIYINTNIYIYINTNIYIFTVIYIYLHIRICLHIMTYIHLHLFVCIYTSYKFSIQCAYHVFYFPFHCADAPSRLIFLRRVQNINQNHGSFGFGSRLADVTIKTTNHNVPKPMNDLQF